MRFVVPAVLLLVAAIHALPLLGVLGAARISGLYGIAVDDPNLEILMRHRAVLFGLLAAFLAYAAFHRPLHGLALIGGAVSVVAFLALALSVGRYNPAIGTVVRVDVVALLLLALAAWVHLRSPGGA
ncbi:MAG: phosphopantetheine adenylyltransferase [Rubrivivax sp.]